MKICNCTYSCSCNRISKEISKSEFTLFNEWIDGWIEHFEDQEGGE